jgi:N-acetylneuraminate synthase
MNKTQIKLSKQCIADNQPPYLIAEIGINHNGDLQTTKKLIDAAFATQWECVKFQKRTPSLCVPEDQKSVIRDTPWGSMTYLDYKNKIEFQQKEYDYIDRYCQEKPIQWSASVWDIPSLEFLLNYNVPYIKIPSAKLTDIDLLMESARSSKPVLLSTGMSTIDEIDKSVDILEKYSDGYILLHTNSAYPAPTEELNLRMIQTLKNRYKCLVGYSGHEFDLEPSVIAVSMGACLIERHVTLDHNMWGSDHHASLEVHAMDMLRKRIGSIRLMVGDGKKIITENEKKVREKLRGK